MLNLAHIRQAYFHPLPDNPERVPSREEIYAQRERLRVETCLGYGGDLQLSGLGEYGSLIGGAGKPLSTGSMLPECIARLKPLPLSWFDYSLAHSSQPPPGGNAAAQTFLFSLSADHLAGMSERPDGAQLLRLYRASEYSDLERMQMWHIFACIRMMDLRRLLSRAGLSVFEIARAIHLSETQRAAVCTWINNFAIDPKEHGCFEAEV